MSPSLSSSDTYSTIIFQKPRDKKYYAIIIFVLLAIISASVAVIVMRLDRNKNEAPNLDIVNHMTSQPSTLSPSSSRSSNFFEYKKPQEMFQSPLHSLPPVIGSTSFSPSFSSQSQSKDHIITSVSKLEVKSENPSVYKTSTPSILNTPTPTLSSHTIKPSVYPSHILTLNPSNSAYNQKDIKFYVLGDIPYNRKGKKVFYRKFVAMCIFTNIHLLTSHKTHISCMIIY